MSRGPIYEVHVHDHLQFNVIKPCLRPFFPDSRNKDVTCVSPGLGILA